jgi:glycosyltransferase involved in cell wall biosynthesis
MGTQYNATTRWNLLYPEPPGDDSVPPPTQEWTPPGPAERHMEKSPRILHLVTDLRLGGTQTILLERLRRSREFRHGVMVFARHTGRPGDPGSADTRPDLWAECRASGADLVSLDLPNRSRAIGAWLGGRLARRTDAALVEAWPTLIHSTLHHTHLLGDWLARRHHLPHLAGKEGIDVWMGPLARRLEAVTLLRATRVAAISQATAESARRLGVPRERITIVPNGIDLMRPGNWDIPAHTGDGPRLLGVGRFERIKGWGDLIAALSLLRGHFAGLTLDLLGGGSEEAAMARAVRRLGLKECVRIRARVPEAEARAEDGAEPAPILVVPSWEEGFGLILLEGMARGLPIVATRVGGIPEVARDGEEALLVPPRDPAALAAAIARLLEDGELRHRLTRAGRKRVEFFTADVMVRGYEKIYREILSAPDPRRRRREGRGRA